MVACPTGHNPQLRASRYSLARPVIIHATVKLVMVKLCMKLNLLFDQNVDSINVLVSRVSGRDWVA